MKSPFIQALEDDPTALAAAVYRYLLDSVPRLQRVPTPTEIRQNLDLGKVELTEALRELESHFALRLDATTGSVGEVYPYSAFETKHEVAFDSGVRVYCMCAIDCFYVPFLTGCDVTIYSDCHLCDRRVEIVVKRSEVRQVEPPSTVVWDSDAPYDCPTTNFFCSRAHLHDWREVAADDPGSIRSVAEAMERGRAAAAAICRVIAPQRGTR